MLDKEVIELVKSKIDIVEVVSEYISLQKVGKNFRALCPFHNEKTPSFYVNSEKGLYHCFGCGASGDVIKFVQEIEGISFIDALKKLADRAGVKLPITYDSEVDNEYVEYVRLYSRLAEIYHKNLFKYGESLDYLLNSRKIDLSIIKKFRLGFCPTNSRVACMEAKKLGIADSKLLRFGLMNTRCIDLFSGRIVFPILNNRGHTVAFGGRVLNDRGSIPKYINTAETTFFSKSNVFFGSKNALRVAREANFIILVEGYFDVLALNTCGIENVLAPMGTTLSQNQIKKILKFTKNIILFFDSDNAGRTAMIKLIPKLEEDGLNIAVVSLDNFKDASEILQKKNQEYLKSCIGNAIGYEEFLVKEFSRDLDLDNPSGMENFLERLRPFALQMLEKRPVRYEHLIEIITNKLRLREAIVRSFFSRDTVSNHKKSQNFSIISSSSNGEVSAKKNEVDLLVKIFIDFRAFRERALEIMKNYRNALDDFGIAFLDFVENEKFFSEDIAIEKLPEEHSNRFFKILMMDIEQLNLEKVLLDCEEKLRKKNIIQEIHQIDEKLKTAKDKIKKDLLRKRMALLSYLKGGKSP